MSMPERVRHGGEITLENPTPSSIYAYECIYVCIKKKMGWMMLED